MSSKLQLSNAKKAFILEKKSKQAKKDRLGSSSATSTTDAIEIAARQLVDDPNRSDLKSWNETFALKKYGDDQLAKLAKQRGKTSMEPKIVRNHYFSALTAYSKAILYADLEKPAANEDDCKRLLRDVYFQRAKLYSHGYLNKGREFQRHAISWLRRFTEWEVVLDTSKDRNMATMAKELVEAFYDSMNAICYAQSKLAMQSNPEAHIKKKLNRNMQIMHDMVAKADSFLFVEAYATFSHPDKHRHLLACYKNLRKFVDDHLIGKRWFLEKPSDRQERLKRLAEADNPTNSQLQNNSNRNFKQNMFNSSLKPIHITNIFDAVHIDGTSNTLKARKCLYKGQIIFYAPIVVAQWNDISHFCASCNKRLGHYFLPCPNCSQATFCSQVCIKWGYRHDTNKCKKYATAHLRDPKSSLKNSNAYLIYQMVCLLGGPTGLKTLLEGNKFRSIKKVMDDMDKQPGGVANLHSYSVAMLLARQAEMLNKVQTDIPGLYGEARCLNELIKCAFSEDGGAKLEDVTEVLYKMLFFLNTFPLAVDSITEAAPEKKIGPQYRERTFESAQNHRPIGGKPYGIAFSAFDACFATYEVLSDGKADKQTTTDPLSKANVKRQLNPNGNIEYVALQKIEVGAQLILQLGIKVPTNAKWMYDFPRERKKLN